MAQFYIGYCYFYGYGCDKDEERGMELMEECSNEDDFIWVMLGQIYHSAGPKHQSFLKALEYYQHVSAGIQRSYALRGIGLLYEYGDDVEQSYHEALAYYQKAADEHNKGAYYNIALLHYYGNGVAQNYVNSFEWFAKVVKGEAKEDITHVCVLDEKRDQDVTNSKKQKIYSIETETFIYGEAHFYLGIMSKKGQGTCVDQEKSAKHFQMAISYESLKAKEFTEKRLLK